VPPAPPWFSISACSPSCCERVEKDHRLGRPLLRLSGEAAEREQRACGDMEYQLQRSAHVSVSV
jgi:hypothetical protein